MAYDHGYWTRDARRFSRRAALKGAFGVAGLAATGALSACGPSSGPPAALSTAAPGAGAPPAPGASPAAAAARPKYGGTLVLSAGAEAPNQDVHMTLTAYLQFYGPGLVYSRLMNYEAGPKRQGLKNIPTGDVAERWEQADDLTWIFKIRPGIRWHNITPLNGREFTADDVAYSFNRQIALKVGAGYLPAMQKIEAVDGSTLKITLPKPDADFLPIVAHPFNKLVAKEAVDANGDLKNGPAIGTGPWILEAWERDTTARFIRNPDYFLKGLPYLDRLEIPRIKDEQTSRSAVRAKAVHAAPTGVVRSELEKIKREDPSLTVVTYKLYNSGNEIAFNVTRTPFQDRRVRLAISKAVDRQGIIDSVFEGDGWWSVAIPLPDPDWYLPEDEVKKAYARDVAGARRLLAEAGLANGFDAELTVLNLSNIYIAPAEIVQQNLKEIGVNATIKLVDAATWTDNVNSRGEHQFYCGAISPTGVTNLELFSKYHSTGNRNASQLKDPKLDEMIEKQAVMRDPEQRKRALQEIQRYLLDEAYHAFVLTTLSTTAYWNFVKDYAVGLPTYEYDYLAYLWLDK